MPSPDHDSKTNRMQELNGVFWDQCEIPYGISSPIDREKCCLFLLENLAPYTWNTLRSFENSLQRSLKQLPYWLATLSADSAISICCRSKITVTVQRLWQASSRKTNLSYPLRQPVIYTTTSEKRTPWSGVSFGRKMSACITFHLFLRPTISRRLFKTVSTFCNMKSPILWNAPSASFFSWQGISPSMTQTSEPLR